MRGLLWLLVLSALAVALSLAMRGHGAYAVFVLPHGAPRFRSTCSPFF